MFVENENDPRKMLLFSMNQGMNHATFICPKCIDQPEVHTKESFTRAVKSILNTATTLLSRKEAAQVRNSQSPTPLEEVPQQNGQMVQHLSHHLLEDLQLQEGSTTTLQRPRNEKYHGYDKALIRSLVRKIDENIYNYNKEVCDVLERFGDPEDDPFKGPLKTWHLIDARMGIAAGQEWYQSTNGPTDSLKSKGHAPITASLRTMLKTDESEPLEFAPGLGDLNFSQVHSAFVAWFVIDVLSNRMDIFQLPNMKPMRAMMAGVSQFGEESKCMYHRKMLQN